MHTEHDRRDGNENRDLYKGPLRALGHVDTQSNEAFKEQKKQLRLQMWTTLLTGKGKTATKTKQRDTQREGERERFYSFFFSTNHYLQEQKVMQAGGEPSKDVNLLFLPSVPSSFTGIVQEMDSKQELDSK